MTEGRPGDGAGGGPGGGPGGGGGGGDGPSGGGGGAGGLGLSQANFGPKYKCCCYSLMLCCRVTFMYVPCMAAVRNHFVRADIKRSSFKRS